MKTSTKLNKITSTLAIAGIVIPASPFDSIDIENHNARRVEILANINDLLKKLNKLDSNIRNKVSGNVTVVTNNKPKASCVKIDTLKAITEILTANPSGLGTAEILTLVKANSGVKVSYSRVYNCLRTHGRFYRSGTVPFVWHVDNNANA